MADEKAYRTDPAAVIKREQAYIWIEQQQLKCAGNLSEEDRNTIGVMRKAGREEEAIAYERAHRGIKQEGPYGTVYTPCGFDFGSIVKAGPLDGRDYLATCPKCKTEISYKAPWFPSLPDEEKKEVDGHDFVIRADLRYAPAWLLQSNVHAEQPKE